MVDLQRLNLLSTRLPITGSRLKNAIAYTKHLTKCWPNRCCLELCKIEFTDQWDHQKGLNERDSFQKQLSLASCVSISSSFTQKTDCRHSLAKWNRNPKKSCHSLYYPGWES